MTLSHKSLLMQIYRYSLAIRQGQMALTYFSVLLRTFSRSLLTFTSFNVRKLQRNLHLLDTFMYFEDIRQWQGTADFLAAIAQILPSFPDLLLEQQIIAEADGQDPTWSPPMQTVTLPLTPGQASTLDLAEDAVVLLAQGILRQYSGVLNREIVRQDDSMPSELYRAMCKLGRLDIEAGLPDRAACVHNVLERARYPLLKIYVNLRKGRNE